MKKIYISILIILSFLLITSTYASAGLSLISNNSEPNDSLGSGGAEISSEPSGPDLEGPQINDDSISSGNDAEFNLEPELSIDKLPKVKIESIEPNPTYVKMITTFKGLISNPEKNNISYKWDFGDGEIYQDLGSSHPVECEITHIYSASGTFTVSLYLLKEDIEIDLDTAQVTVIEALSDANAGGPYLGLIGHRIWFGASKTSSFAMKSSSNSYEWNFGDGTNGSGERISHQYIAVGKYPILLTVTDENGNTATDSTTVTIAKITISIHPSNPIVGEEVSFGVEILGFTPTSYNWQFGDGFYGMEQSAIHTYNKAGSYYGRLKIADQDGSYLFSNFIIIINSENNQNNQKPISHFSISSTKGDTSTVFEFEASPSFDPDGEIVLYEWYFGDGKMIITKNAKCNYMFNKEGQWEIKCIVIDNDGRFGSSSKKVEVIGEDNSPSDKTIGYQDGFLFYNGYLGKIDNQPKTGSQLIKDTGEPCDLEISVDYIPDLSKSSEPVKLRVTITDYSGNYEANSVDIKLTSNIPGYESFDYYAKKDQDSKNYYIDIEIPNTPEDAKPYTLSLVANPQSGYSETDWSENSWSEMISEEESESTDLTSDPALDTIIYGNFAL